MRSRRGVASTLREALDVIGAQTNRVCGAAWLVEQDALRCVATWTASPEDEEIAAFLDTTAETRFPAGVGLPGRVLTTGAPARIASLEADTNFPRRPAARRAGLVGGMAIPVVVNGSTSAVLEFFSRGGGDDDVWETLVAPLVAAQIGVVLERIAADVRARAVADESTQRALDLDLAVRQLERCRQSLSEREAALDKTHRLAEIGRRTASVAHDLRNPLQAMRIAHAFLSLGEPARIGEMVRLLGDSLDRCTAIVGDLLDSAREAPLDRKPVALRALVSDAIATVQLSTTVRIENVVPEGAPAVLVDGPAMHRALVNLIQNAVDATGDGHVVVGALPKNDACEISIADEGPGLPEKEAALFEPLFTTKPGGTGLGLSIVRAIVERHGGTVSLRNAKPRGAVATVRVPKA